MTDANARLPWVVTARVPGKRRALSLPLATAAEAAEAEDRLAAQAARSWGVSALAVVTTATPCE